MTRPDKPGLRLVGSNPGKAPESPDPPTADDDAFLAAALQAARSADRTAARQLLGERAFRILESAVRLAGENAPYALEETAPTGTLSKARRRALNLASRMQAEDLRRWQSLLKPLNTENPPS